MDLYVVVVMVVVWVLVISVYFAWYFAVRMDDDIVPDEDHEDEDHESVSEWQASVERHPSHRGRRRSSPPVGVCHVCHTPRTLIRKSEEFSICAGCLKEAMK